MSDRNAGELRIAPEVVRTAIDWLLRVQSDASVKPACEQWQQQSHEHALAWQRVAALDDQLDVKRDAHGGAFPQRLLLSEALERGVSRLQQRRRALKLLSLTLVGGTAAWVSRDLAHHQGWLAEHSTLVGERRRLTLDDGTVLALNTDSAVDLRFDGVQRLIQLRRGEVLVTSGADVQSALRRPLRVQTAHGLFEAIGTRFAVRLEDGATWMGVQEGIVQAQAADVGQTPIRVHAGQAVRVGARIEVAGDAGMSFAAWDEGVLDVRDMPLTDFIAEVARYRRGILNCDPQLAALRVSGVFQLSDIDQLLAILPRMLPVKLESRTRWWLRVVPVGTSGA